MSSKPVPAAEIEMSPEEAALWAEFDEALKNCDPEEARKFTESLPQWDPSAGTTAFVIQRNPRTMPPREADAQG